MLYSGAKKPLVRLAIDFLKSVNKVTFPLSALMFSSLSLTLTRGLFSSTIVVANLIASANRFSSLANSSTNPISRHCLAGTCCPDVTICKAFCAPTILGKRCVPPAPGNNPRFTSGRPHLAEGTAIR